METFRKLVLGTMLLGMASLAALLVWRGPGILRAVRRQLSVPPFNGFRHVDGAAALLPDGRILIAGACQELPAKNAEIYDPASNHWQACPPMKSQRMFDPLAASMPDGRVLVAGGSREVGVPVLEIEAFDPRTVSWSVIGRLPSDMRVSDLAALRDGRLLLSTQEGGASGLLCLDPGSGRLQPVGHPDMVVNGSPRLTSLSDGRVLVTHLSYGVGDQTNAFLFDPASGRTVPLPRMAQGRQEHEATLLKDGRVLVTGGSDGEPSAEIFDPARARFLPAGSMVAPRCLHAAVRLGDGRVLIADGVPSLTTGDLPAPDQLAKMSPSDILKSMPKRGKLDAEVECFDPKTNTFTAVPDPPSPIHARHGGMQFLSPDGRALFLSFQGPLYFDPATSTWQFPAEGRAQAPHGGRSP